MAVLEVLLAGVLLAVCALALLLTSLTSSTSNRQSLEYIAAQAAARSQMEEICGNKFGDLVGNYGKTNPLVGNTFKVYLNESPEFKDDTGKKSKGVELKGFRKLVNGAENFDAGEIVIVTHESDLPSTYGYSCSTSSTDSYPDNGKPGGIGFKGIPIDLNADGNTTSGNCWDFSVNPPVTTAVRLPVGVIVRWRGPKGPERYELWTIVTQY